MENSVYLGSAYIALFRVMDDHSGIANKDTGVLIPTPALSDAAIILMDDSATENIVESSKIAYDSAGIPSVDVVTSIMDIVEFMATAAPRKTGASSITRNEKQSEKGLKIGGPNSGTGNPNYLAIWPQGLHGANILQTSMLCLVKPESGAREFKAGDTTMPGFQLIGVPCKKSGGLVIDQVLYDATIFGTIPAGDRTIAEDHYLIEKLVPHA